MTNPIEEQVINFLFTNTYATYGYPALFLGSIYLNYMLWQRISRINSDNQRLKNIFQKIEPIIKKIINKERLNETDIDDLKEVRRFINFYLENDNKFNQ